MDIEELKKEIEKMLCPWHMNHPTVEVSVTGELNIKACCDEFKEQIFKRIDDQALDGISSGTV
jgi:hypothetical protein